MTQRASPTASTAQTSDLFGGLRVRSASGDLPAARVDLGWGAWRSALADSHGRWQRLRLWLALWRHVGQARFFVQVDNEYRVATSLSIRKRAGGPGLEVRLLQAATPWQSLLRCLRRRGPDELLSGYQVKVSRHPASAAASTPALPGLDQAACPEAVLDGLRPCTLPLQVDDH